MTRLLELIQGKYTSQSAMDAAHQLATCIGKDPCVLNKDVPGFIANRLAYAVFREALHLQKTGVADAESIDLAFRNGCGHWATIFGPLRWIDITGGPELYKKAMRGVLPTLSNATEPPSAIQKLADAGARGSANGRGFYQYTNEDARDALELHQRHVWNVYRLMKEDSRRE